MTKRALVYNREVSLRFAPPHECVGAANGNCTDKQGVNYRELYGRKQQEHTKNKAHKASGDTKKYNHTSELHM